MSGDIHYEADGFPEYVPLTAFDRYDFDSRIPDRIVIQNPYDEYDCAITVHPRFYTKKLLAATKELVYIPYFNIDDSDLEDEKMRYMADFYIKMPGVTRADRVYLQSEAAKDLYVDKLCEFAGDDTRPVWEKKIVVREDLRPEKSAGIREDDIPDGWWKYLLDENDEGKKVLLYHTGISDIVVFQEKAIEKIKGVLDILKKNSAAMTPIWHAHPQTRIILESRYPKLWELYRAVLEQYLTDDFGIYEDCEDYSRCVAIADAYYGDRDKIMHDFVLTGRPVMISNVEV